MASRSTLIAVAAALVTGCAGPKLPATADGVRSATTVRDSSFDAVATVVGPEQRTHTQRGALSDLVTWRVRVHITKSTNTAVPQLYASVWHQDRSARRYTSASLEGGRQLEATRIDYEPRCNAGGGFVSCTHTETVGVTIPAEAWAAAASSGVQIRLNSQAGLNNVVSIPPEYARGLSDAVAARGATFSGPK